MSAMNRRINIKYKDGSCKQIISIGPVDLKMDEVEYTLSYFPRIGGWACMVCKLKNVESIKITQQPATKN